MKVSAPFNHRVPKELRANLRWRQQVHKRVADDPAFAEVIKQACKCDPLFFLNGFGWTYDPRREPFSRIPFILYDFQEEAVLQIIRAIRDHDLLVEKSRDMGASWLCISSMTWCWWAKPGLSFLWGSRVEDYVDKPGNSKALFWKFDFLFDNLPPFLRPQGWRANEHRMRMHVENPETGSIIDGESTTANFARGDRRTAILLDEFAMVDMGHHILSATRDATDCRLFNSTPKGTNNAFYDMRQTRVEKLRLHWSEHPIKARGLYTTDDEGNLKVLDRYGYPDGYEPILDGKLRSPWYDRECERASGPQEIAQELDIDYLGSGFQYFKPELVHEAIRKYARPPLLVGDLDYDTLTGEPTEFRENPEGKLRLWFLLDRDGKPPKDRKYSLGNDVSAGTGASNSCSAGWECGTHSKVLEYVDPYVRPEEFAKQATAIARWLNNALMIWESGGPGRQFGSRVIELGYGNIYYRRRDEKISRETTDIPGYATTKDSKLALLGAYRSLVEKLVCVNRSKEALEETLEYIHLPDGGVAHSRSTSKSDPSGARANHGDRVIADALGCLGVSERARNPVRKKPEVPYGSLAWRNKQREAEKRDKERDGW